MKTWWRNLTDNGRVIAMTGATVIGMGSLGWASVPLYDLFCRVTGYGGTTSQAEAGSDVVLDQTVLVRFDASRERGMPWEFSPVQNQMRVRIGETNLAFYEAHNPTDKPVAGTASFNVAPFAAGAHFVKIDCFCFEEQILQPGETVSMPVTFFVDPEIVEDPEAKGIPEITLSYTFHVMDLPEDYAALDTGALTTTN
ncbi:cytochrome c oxidase assembly protein CtaG [Jannaschia pagri]|uniref:Cytochrome c oxidase assembly protein CtaG n=1 Tax=Jannaschia pagri TaxID=2829797 RepID=A0ABQ4NKC9_9RHOB|nr:MULTISPECIES: cytochrome c oxidase assembly protein [unclassified Jannaschia]GIT91037.1 cytochrome c oxidase assembly protein CtaG [Jannaschia sp. AI_61]GIT94869.1 cytochrome c oxidase assembly protein CtaG [Jannaschia sp. AI_62]